ncbi:uncharacterized protein LOC129591667 isoform X2 [Paramacrobiotus metropolitanus]|uniref:uncharacterized protein LOC129591667 isoform X2 n=1 Tax=Paramacrobiotus metropolitanus TaxID=2943436 RepID=UPI0024460976|nr:uncharacterized protein LOC129591667 isoform X2 [Paramacrobiotus metropolitanus]
MSDQPNAKNNKSDVSLPAQEEVHLSDLPYDALTALSLHLEPTDILHGLYETNRQLHETFKSEQYWQQRIKIQFPAVYGRLSARHSSSSSGDPLFWRKAAYRCESIRENFKSDRMVQTTWASHTVDGYYEPDEGDDEELSGLIDISCIAFCDHGNVLVVGDSDRYEVLYWNTRGQSRPPYSGAPDKLRHIHESVICTLKGLDNRVASGSYDGTVAISDFNALDAEPVRLKSKDKVLSMAWSPYTLVTGLGNGSYEVFDERVSDQAVISSQPILDPVELFDGIEVHLDDTRILAAGWENESRTLKSVDLRFGAVLHTATIPGIVLPPPAGHWGQRVRYKAATHLQEGQFFLGAESGKVFHYDAKSLELVKELTEVLGHSRHIAGLHYTGSQIITVSRAGRTRPDLYYRTVVHEFADNYPLLWEFQISAFPGSISAMDFSEDRCALAVALTNQVQLWRPEVRSRRNSSDGINNQSGDAYVNAPD